MKKHGFWRMLMIDAACAGLALVVFALFHHVLPRRQESLGIVTGTGSAVITAEAEEAVEAQTPTAAQASATAVPGAVSGATPGNTSVSSRRARRTASASRTGGGSGRSRSGSSEKGGSALTGTDAGAEAAPENTADMAESFAEHYTDQTEVTANSYTSPNLSVTVTEESLYGSSVTCYIADIYVKDITAFRTVLAGNTYGSGYRDEIEDMAALSGALVAVNGDYYGNTNEGVVIRNGVIYRANPTNCDVCVLYRDGTLRTMAGSSFSVEEAVEDGAWQAWTFGPALLDGEGHALTAFSSTNRLISANPRTAIGYYAPGHYCLVVVDGRGESAGLTLPQLASLFESLGCAAAYNLDGGNSSVMVWNGGVINHPSGGGRASSDALVITEVN